MKDFLSLSIEISFLLSTCSHLVKCHHLAKTLVEITIKKNRKRFQFILFYSHFDFVSMTFMFV